MKEPIYTSRWSQLAKWWDTATITKPDEVNAIAKRLVAAKDRYQRVEAKTGVPWWMIAAIHQREASQNWDTQLAQGDPLHKVSTHVPKGMGPFDTWEDGAVAALKHDGLTSVKDWGLEKALHCQEKYNGWGYFYRGIPSPYIWAGTSIQRPGKFVADGQWSPTTMDRQLGCAAILKGMMAIDPSITPARESAGPETGEFVAPSRPPPAEGAGEVKGTGLGLLNRAQKHIGEEYVNIQVPKDDSKWTGPWDCAEFMSWLVYQETGILYGCVDDNAEPSEADAYTGAWRTDVARLGIPVSVEEAASTVGGIVLRYPPPGGMGHIALCDGRGGTVEAKGRKYGVVADTVHGRTWHTGVLIPGIKYDSRNAVTPVKPPADLYARNAPNMESAIIVKIQEALASKGFSPGGIDGEFGPETEAAVVAFQLSEGLVADGQVGRDTADALGISLTGAKPKPAGPAAKPVEPPKKPAEPIIRPLEPPGLGVGTMNPLIMIAAQVLPGIIQALAGDKAGTVAGAVTKAVTEITQTKDPEEAQNKLKADPAAVTALQLKLAEIAAAQEEARQKAQLDLIKEQNEQEIKRQQTQLEALKVRYEEDAKKREADFQGFRAGLDDTKDARASLRAMTALAGADKWVLRAPPILSYIVAAGFFAVLTFLLIWGIAPLAQEPDAAQQVVYIVIGALTAALATVVNFWLGSSQSSQRKDAASERQAIHNTEFLERSAKQNAEVLDKSAKQAEAQTKAFQSTIATVIEKKAGVAATKAPNAIDRCVDIVLKHETDPDLKKLPPDQAREIYRTKYWNVLRCDDLPAGVDLVVFDLGVEAGPAEAAAALQRVVGAEADSSVGPATIAATKAGSPSDIVMRLSQLRRESKHGTSEGIGRINEVEIAAQQMVAAASAVAV
jgi:lysozyme family protein/peptidoglycan hydrolase-like protein with peptidoglycan-binding domain